MVTVPSTPRINTIDLASASAGPFEIGFRLFEVDAVEVYVNGDPVASGFTIATNFVGGYDDDATITFDAALEIGDQIKLIGNMVPERGNDYGPTEPKLTEKLNLELGRLTAQVSETRKIAMQGLRTFSDQVPFAPEDGKPPVYDQALGRFKNGPSVTEISNAQGYAEEAQRIADEFGDLEQASADIDAAVVKAQEWAENPEDAPVEPGEFSSKHWSAKSETIRNETAQLKADVELIKAYIGSAVVPIGTLAYHYFDEVPDGWLRVQGQAVTPDMPDLRQKLIDDGATLDGNGDPLLQDPRGRVVRIWDPDGNLDPEIAREIRSFQADALQEHGHTYTGTVANDGSGQGSRTYLIFDDSGGSVTDAPVSTNIDTTGGTAKIDDETRMANVAYPLIIKAFHAYANLSGKIVPLGTAAEEDVEAFYSGLSYGSSTSPFVGAASANDAIRIMQAPVVQKGQKARVRYNAGAVGSLVISVWSLAGTTLTKERSTTVAVLAAGEAVSTVDLLVNEGEYLAVEPSATGVLLYEAGGGGEYWTLSAGATSGENTTTAAANLDLEITVLHTVQTAVGYLDGKIAALPTPSDLAAVQAKADANTAEIYVTTTQAVGPDVDPFVGASNASTGVFINQEPAEGDGTITDLRALSNVTGTIYVSVWDLVGSTLTRQSETALAVSATGENNYETSIPIAEGQFIGFSGSATGVLGFDSDAGGAHTDYWALSFGDTSGTTASESGVILTAQATITYNVSRLDSLEAGTSQTNSIDLSSAKNKIAVIGDSTLEGMYYLRGQHWLQRASANTPWTFFNYSISGDDASEQLADLRAKATPYGSVSIADLAPAYALIMLGINDKSAYDEDTFVNNMVAIGETVLGMGTQPIICTPWINGYSFYGTEVSERENQVTMYRKIADRLGCPLIDVYGHVRRMLNVSSFSELDGRFFVGVHPGTRSGALMSGVVSRAIASLPRPETGLKLFTMRPTVSPAGAADLRFDTLAERDELFNEVLVGGNYIDSADADFIDTLTPNSGYARSDVNGVYDTALGGTLVTTSEDWALIEVILPGPVAQCGKLSIDIGGAGVSAYGRDVLSGAYPALGTPVGEMIPLTVSGTVITPTAAQLKKIGRGDSLHVWLNKSGGVPLQNISVSFTGATMKGPFGAGSPVLSRAKGAELLSQTDCGTASGWTSSGSPVVGVSDITELALGSTGVTKVTDTASISQAIAFSSSYDDIEAHIAIVAAWAPDAFVQGVDTYPADSAIVEYSWPCGWLVVTLSIDSVDHVFRVPVPPYSDEIRIPITLPFDLSSATIKLEGEDSTGIEVARVSVREVV